MLFGSVNKRFGLLLRLLLGLLYNKLIVQIVKDYILTFSFLPCFVATHTHPCIAALVFEFGLRVRRSTAVCATETLTTIVNDSMFNVVVAVAASPILFAVRNHDLTWPEELLQLTKNKSLMSKRGTLLFLLFCVSASRALLPMNVESITTTTTVLFYPSVLG